MNCPSCNRPLPADAPGGLCPQCLVRGGLGTHASIDPASTAADVGRQPRFAPPPAEEIADVFPQLEVLEFVGQGGMGAVYKARQKQLDRIIALKILPPDIGDDPAFCERFTREAKAMARLSHPGIVTIHDFGQEGNLFYFVMEYIDGLNLGELIRSGQVSPKEALQIVPQICDALQYAHDQGIVHRDIKPENILLDRQGHVKVADFGLAKLMGTVEETPGADREHRKSSTLTAADKVMGTPQYMAPEQRERPLEVDHRADVYSLGVVFYQLLTGELPAKPIEPPSHRVQIDVRLDEVVLRALEQEPGRRYQQASVLKTRVETIASTLPPEQDLRAPSRESTDDPTRFARTAWQIWIIAVFLVLEGVANLAAIPANPVAAIWLVAKCVFIAGLLRRWQWVFLWFLLEAAIHTCVFLPINVIAAILNLAMLILAASAWRRYFPRATRGEHTGARRLVRPMLTAVAVTVLSGLLQIYSIQWLSDTIQPIPLTRGPSAAESGGWVSAPNTSAQAAAPVTNPSSKRPISYYADLQIDNPSMEDGTEEPAGWQEGASIPGVEYIWDRSVGHNSQSSVCLHKTADRYFPIAQWSQTVPWDGDHPFLYVGAQVKAVEVTKAIIDVIFLDREKETISHQWASHIGATESDGAPVTHDWKDYSGQVTIPRGTAYIQLAFQIYGPGKIWFDNVRASPTSTPLTKVDATPGKSPSIDPPDDVADVPCEELNAGNDRMRYFLIGPKGNGDLPEDGYKLVVVLPGGDGGAGFNPFVRRILKDALGTEYLIAQPVAFKWHEAQMLTWPTRNFTVAEQEFSTEDFVSAVVADVKNKHEIDERFVFTLSWSSGGPAGYAVSLAENTPITGSYVAMSVFKPEVEPPLAHAKGHAYFIDHSPDDRVCPFFMAKEAERLLKEHGASVKFNTYDGGHGWRGDVYGRIRSGIRWLEGEVAEK